MRFNFCSTHSRESLKITYIVWKQESVCGTEGRWRRQQLWYIKTQEACCGGLRGKDPDRDCDSTLRDRSWYN